MSIVAKRTLPEVVSFAGPGSPSTVLPLQPNQRPHCYRNAASSPTASPPADLPLRGIATGFETATRRLIDPSLIVQVPVLLCPPGRPHGLYAPRFAGDRRHGCACA